MITATSIQKYNYKPNGKNGLPALSYLPKDVDITLFVSPLAEQIVLATLLVYGDKFSEIVDKLKIEDFWDIKNQQIFQAMLNIYQKNELIDVVTVCAEDKTIDASYVSSLITTMPECLWQDYIYHGERLQQHTKKLLETSLKRQAYQSISQGQEINAVVERIDALNRLGNDKLFSPQEWGMYMTKEIEQIKTGNKGISYPWSLFNNFAQEIQKGQLILVAAMPSVGKTTLLQNIAIHAGKQGFRTLFATIEMSASLLGRRFLSQINQTNYFDKPCDLPQQQTINQLVETKTHMHQLSTMAELESKIKNMYNEIDLIIVDFVQLLMPKMKLRSGEDFQRVTAVVLELAALKNKYNLPIIVASQYNRQVNGQPGLSDLRSSGQLEISADLVFSLWKAKEDIDNYTGNKTRVRIDLLKNRNGPCFFNSKIKEYFLWHIPELFTFSEETLPPW